jgi:3-oxoacyl-[acyl-carrier protein] reductase
MFDLKGKKALITGASGGIGIAIAECFLECGCNVFLTSSSEQKLQNLVTNLKERFSNSQIEYQAFNLSKTEEVEKIVDIASQKMSGLDVVICNAGVTKDCLAIRMKYEDWQDVIDINLTANFVINKNAAKHMIKQKYGRIINISSVVGLTGNIGQINYVASKAGLIGMTKSLAIEVASRGITVNCIAPGFIQTEMTDKMSETAKSAILGKIPMGYYGKPRDVANICIFLASEEASYITGQTIGVNGGMFMN